MATVKLSGFNRDYVRGSGVSVGTPFPVRRLATTSEYEHIGVAAADILSYAATQGGRIVGGVPTGGGYWTLTEVVVTYGDWEIDPDAPPDTPPEE